LNNFEYFNPSSLKEASELMVKNGNGAHILNGGTDLITQMHERLTLPEVVVDIKKIKELHGIRYEEGKGLTIGACVTLNELGENEIVIEKYPFLAKAAMMVGSRQVRNRATCIGNICNASPLADTATPLLALDAEVNVYGPEGTKTISIHDFFVFVRKTCLKPGEIVQSIFVPEIPAESKGVFIKISRRKEVDLSTVCATLLRVGDSYRISYGSVAPTPIRVRKTEELLKGKTITEEIVADAISVAQSEVSPIDDNRASKEYRIDMVGVLIKNGLAEIAK
jgi:carbon-monoxide dehydrogenase medium subunit